MDQIYHGSDDEKAKIAFMMMDVQGNGKIFLESYRDFWIKFLEMYGELLQTKFTYDEESETVTQMCFEKISKACNAEGETRKCESTGKDCFTFEDFKQAREDNPELFEWIDEPERYVEEFMKQNAKKDQMSQVKFDDFEAYHMSVMSSI